MYRFVYSTRLLTDFLVLKVAVEEAWLQERVTVRPGKINQLGALIRKA